MEAGKGGKGSESSVYPFNTSRRGKREYERVVGGACGLSGKVAPRAGFKTKQAGRSPGLEWRSRKCGISGGEEGFWN